MSYDAGFDTGRMLTGIHFLFLFLLLVCLPYFFFYMIEINIQSSEIRFIVFYISLLYNEFLVTGAMDTFPAFYLLLFCVPVYVYGT